MKEAVAFSTPLNMSLMHCIVAMTLSTFPGVSPVLTANMGTSWRVPSPLMLLTAGSYSTS